MNRDQYTAARSRNRALRRDVRRFSMTERQSFEHLRHLTPLPEPPRSEIGQLLIDQRERRLNRVYWAGYRARQAALDALPPIPSRIPMIPGWDRSEGSRA